MTDAELKEKIGAIVDGTSNDKQSVDALKEELISRGASENEWRFLLNEAIEFEISKRASNKDVRTSLRSVGVLK